MLRNLKIEKFEANGRISRHSNANISILSSFKFNFVFVFIIFPDFLGLSLILFSIWGFDFFL